MSRRVPLFTLVFLFVGSLLAFGQTLNWSTFTPTKQLKITIMTDKSGDPTKPATQDVVTPVLRQKTGVEAHAIPVPSGFVDNATAVQALVAGNNLPDIFTESYVPPQVDAQKVLVDANAVWDFSDIPTLRKLFPNFTRRLDQWGDLNVWYDNERTYNGGHIRITQNIAPIALSRMYQAYKGTTFARKTVNQVAGIGWSYRKYLRDDILRMIYPKARTEAQQEQWFIKNFNYDNPTGASDPYSDIPITSMDDLYNYMKKVKDIIDSKNMKDFTGRDTMIVAQLNAENQNAPSIMWSNLTMYGYWWTEPPFRVADKVYYNFEEPWVKDVLAWWNKIYNEGLLDPEVFVKKTAQVGEEITRGRFAIFPNWGSWINDARTFDADNKTPYGWRELPNWWPITMKNTYNDASNQWVTYFNHFGGNIITKHVSEADLPQVANWLDYHSSEEFDILKTWGPSSFYTGVGKSRRYLPAYKDLENFQVYGTTGPRDGYYYGIMANSPATVEAGAWNYEVQTGNFSTYPLSPQYVYPVVKKAGENFDYEMFDAWTAWYHQKLINFFPQVGWSNSDLNSLPNFSKIQYLWFGSHADAIAKAIVGTQDQFEANYAAYQKIFRDNDFDLGMQEYQIKWKEIFDTYIKKYWKY